MNRVGLTSFVTSAAHWSPGQAPPPGCLVAPLVFRAPVGRLSETAIAFARSCSCGIETGIAFARSCSCGIEAGIAFAGAGRASTETVIAFAGAKWVFLVHFSGAEVMPVSRLPCWGRAEASLVSPSPPQCVLCAKKFSLRGLVVGVCAKKFAQRTKNGPKMAFSGVLGEVFRGNAAGGAVLGEFFRGPAVVGVAAGPSTGSVNPSMRSYTLWVAWWAARPGHHPSG